MNLASMKADHILVPIDLAKCPLEVLPLINNLAGRSNSAVILLHIVQLNILAPDSRICREQCANAGRILERLADRYVNSLVDVRLRVRAGNPFDEIVREARESHAQMILLPTFPSSPWRRLLAPLSRRVAERLAADAPCPVVALPVKTPVNCEESWRRERDVPCAAQSQPKRQSPLSASLPAFQNN